ncbi:MULTISPECIES: mechanosensitive ion channel family protein [unclassified Kaistella]|uniref:mechanosensitive ion channel family protein n=1 Tax=unclassified Kaistella TaxID=2762626 RepID=UPI002732899F|nr:MULTISPECIES: mechanosensitive ion channel domain-containing protein [unclassified Kaistella]MDP2453335.1 mechanosensitive ion channel [Kaistella sp. SH11-4b]MDP2456392.1 mechanosensitive ion channel [Kaistella sp. SH40-3]MDP2459148.1 mechanosensitive ion channel [Kaistella sp. SH19-2b]
MENHQNKKWIIIYSSVAIALIVLYYVVNLPILEPWNHYVPFLRKLSLSLFLISIIFLISKLIERLIYSQNHIEGDRYNLLRIVKFLALVFSLIVAASFLFQNLYAAAVSFGLISLVLGFALQAAIASFIAWVYLVFRRSYLVGDRIQIKGFRGDVVEINYLDTSILECSGDYLGNDRRSGRTIRFPNSLILREEIINYSGPQVPFIWNETAIQISYTSDLQFVEECLLEAARKDFKEEYPQYNMKKHAQWEPAVYFRNNVYAWMEAVVSYPVEPNDTTGRRNRILKYALPKLNEAPDQVQFPEGVAR